MRGIKAATRVQTVRPILSKRAAEAVDKGKTELKLSFYRVWMSGLFYRMYERERAGISVDFSEAALGRMENKTYRINGVNKRIKVEHIQKRKAQDYMDDYQRWKLAFSI